MRRKPWHWPEHVALFPLSAENSSMKMQNEGNGGISIKKSFVGHKLLEWEEFVHRPMNLTGYLEEQQDHNGICQKGYSAKTITPCQRNVSYVPKIGRAHV